MRRWFRTAKKDKIKTVVFPVYFDYKVTIVLTRSIEKALKQFEHTKNVPMTPETSGLTVHVNSEGHSYIFIPYYTGNTGTMVHEAYHAIRRMFEQCDIEMTSEVVAYHLGYLVNEIVELALK